MLGFGFTGRNQLQENDNKDPCYIPTDIDVKSSATQIFNDEF